MPVRDLFGPILRSRTLLEVFILALATGMYSGIAVWKEVSSFEDVGDMPSDIHTVLSFVLGLLLVFRTNAAYSRWWEARTLWGQLVNASRNLAVKFRSLVRLPEDQVAAAGRLVVAFPWALRNHLRGSPATEGISEIQPPPDVHHLPSYIVQQIYALLRHWKETRLVDGDELRVIDRDLARLLDICGGCERILNTRIARSYRTFARQCVLLFLLTLPWGIVHDFRWWTIPLTVIMAYFMLGLEVVAEHVEEPFGYDEDDLDLDGLCRTIEQTVLERLRPITVPGSDRTQTE